jgi:hypothetical protein
VYAIPVASMILLAVIAIAWSPALAVIAVAPLFIAFLVYVGTGVGPRIGENVEPDPPADSTGAYDRTPEGDWSEPRR